MELWEWFSHVRKGGADSLCATDVGGEALCNALESWCLSVFCLIFVDSFRFH